MDSAFQVGDKVFFGNVDRHLDRHIIDIRAHFVREIGIVENAHGVFLSGDDKFSCTLKVVKYFDVLEKECIVSI